MFGTDIISIWPPLVMGVVSGVLKEGGEMSCTTEVFFGNDANVSGISGFEFQACIDYVYLLQDTTKKLGKCL